jgi:hypothetical protein
MQFSESYFLECSKVWCEKLGVRGVFDFQKHPLFFVKWWIDSFFSFLKN